ncbi:hypothetical protein GGR92_002671 [Spirosoma lacussanchae]|uniref:hypothetical protein n=2 Tax=Spirosoma lacussanchae TaxID=1884249 RepID=UPI003D2562FA
MRSITMGVLNHDFCVTGLLATSPAPRYIACQHTEKRTHLTGFDTYDEARTYLTTHTSAGRATTLAIVQTQYDRVVYYKRPVASWSAGRLFSFFL